MLDDSLHCVLHLNFVHSVYMHMLSALHLCPTLACHLVQVFLWTWTRHWSRMVCKIKMIPSMNCEWTRMSITLPYSCTTMMTLQMPDLFIRSLLTMLIMLRVSYTVFLMKCCSLDKRKCGMFFVVLLCLISTEVKCIVTQRLQTSILCSTAVHVQHSSVLLHTVVYGYTYVNLTVVDKI